MDILTLTGFPIHNEFSINVISSFCLYKYSPNFLFPGEYHNDWELVYVDLGEVTIQAQDQTFCVPSGNFFLHSPNEFHTIRANNCICNVLIFTFRMSKGNEELMPLCRRINKVSKYERILLSNLIDEGNIVFDKTNFYKANVSCEPNYGSLQLIRNYLEIFFISALRAVKNLSDDETKENDYTYNEIVSRTIDYLNENINNHIKLEELEKELGYSQSYLSKIFRRITNKSITEYLIDMRITYAKQLMCDQALSFSDIAFQAGFTSLQYFSKMFKLKTGYSPSKYRKSLEIHQRFNFEKI